MLKFAFFLLVQVGLNAFTIDEPSTQLLFSTNPDPIFLEIFMEDRPSGSMAHTIFVDAKMDKNQFNPLFNQIQAAIAPFYSEPLDGHQDSGSAIIVRGKTFAGSSYGVYPFTLKGLAYHDVYSKAGQLRVWALTLENSSWSQHYYKDERPFYLIIGEQRIYDPYNGWY